MTTRLGEQCIKCGGETPERCPFCAENCHKYISNRLRKGCRQWKDASCYQKHREKCQRRA